MNQDQVKEKLLQLEKVDVDFTVTFSGKRSRKVDGLYYPDRREMIIHNHNFVDDNQLMYTAIHEYAHHLHFAKPDAPTTNKGHTNDFWNIFHSLLYKAERLGIYKNNFDTVKELKELTSVLQNNIIKNGNLMSELAQGLVLASRLCKEHLISFDDFLDRVLQLPRKEAKTIIKFYTMDINPKIGYENMKTVTRIKDNDLREDIQKAFLDKKKSPDMVKVEIKPKREFLNRLSFLEYGKDCVEGAIKRLTQKFGNLKREIEGLK
ncbi:MAG: hypothetical protein FWH53_00265 [Leptospirales bacterium]|nr:hypothetical protein [Leptospirales bacterium]